MKRILLSVSIALAAVTSSVAQEPTKEQMELAYSAARNQLGVLSYCEQKGYIDGKAAAVQSKLLALVPVPADTSKGDAAEEAGKNGKVAVM